MSALTRTVQNVRLRLAYNDGDETLCQLETRLPMNVGAEGTMSRAADR